MAGSAGRTPAAFRSGYRPGLGSGGGVVVGDGPNLLLVGLPIDLDALPEELDVLARRWRRKDELHVTVVNGPSAIEQAASVLGAQEAHRRVRDALIRQADAGAVRWAGLTEELRLTRWGADETLVAMCQVDSVVALFAELEAEVGVPIEPPPPHAT